MGGWYAVDALQDAIDETRAFLWPPEPGRWLRLAVIVFFVGGPGGSFGSGLQNAGRGFGREFGDDGGAGPGNAAGDGTGNATGSVSGTDLGRAIAEATSDHELVGLLLVVAVVVLGLVLLFTYLAAVFEFVFYRALRDDEVRLRRQFKRYAWDGVKYALFRLALLLVLFGSIGAVIAAVVLDPSIGLFLLVPVLLLWLLIAVVGFFVHALAIPTMVVEETGFVEALRVTYRRIRREWTQAGVYLLANVAVSIAAGVVVGVGVLVGIVALAIPLVLLGLVLVAIADALVVVPVVLGVIGLLGIYLALAVPVQTFVYRWILDVHAGFADAADGG